MKTHYRILWVDDDLDSVADDIGDIQDFFERYGIEPNIRQFQSGAETNIHDDIKQELDNPDLDLIVVDYLMEGVDGSQLIDEIRESDHIFLPVVFYSSAGPERLHREAADAALDGVYICGRDRVRGKVEEVAKSLLRKEQTSKRTRGLLMEGVCELDANFGTLLLRFWDEMDETQKKALMAYVSEKIAEEASKKKKMDEEMPSELAGFRAYMESSFVSGKFSTVLRWKILKKGVGILGLEGADLDIFFRLFDKRDGVEPLIPLRNAYGHKTRAELEKTHNDDVCINIRREMRAQHGNMQKLLKGSADGGS